MGDKNTIHALVKLLDDTDEEVVNIVESKLIGEGAYYIPELEEIWLENTYPPIKSKNRRNHKAISESFFTARHRFMVSKKRRCNCA